MTSTRCSSDASSPQADAPDGAGAENGTSLSFADLAVRLYRLRRVRTRAFKDDGTLFGEPAWDILLNLYIAHCGDRSVSRVKASTVAGIFQSTGLRMLTELERKGLVVRTDDPNDRRRSFITLSEAAIVLIETSLGAFFEELDF